MKETDGITMKARGREPLLVSDARDQLALGKTWGVTGLSISAKQEELLVEWDALAAERDQLHQHLADLTPLARLGLWTRDEIEHNEVNTWEMPDKAITFGVLAIGGTLVGNIPVMIYTDTESTTRARAVLKEEA